MRKPTISKWKKLYENIFYSKYKLNWFIFSETGEIQRQLEASKAKIIIGTPKTFDTLKTAVENSKKDIKIVCIKTDADESIPSGAIDFADLIETSSKSCWIATFSKNFE